MPLSDDGELRVFDVQRFCIHDGPGIRTTVFLEGCPLRCAFCQNPEAFRRSAPALSPEAVLAEVLKDRDFYAVSGGGLTVSGGEPLLRARPVRALLQAAKREWLHTCVQTSGAVPRASLEAVLGLVDLFQLDLKHMDPHRHRALTGAAPERIHANAAWLVEQGAAVEFRMVVVPGVNDDAENLDRLAAFLTDHGVHAVHLLAYHRLYLEKYSALGLVPPLKRTAAASPSDLQRAAERLSRRAVTASIDA